MVNLDYYGEKPSGSTTFLEFGSINLGKGKKEVYDIRKDQQAYDWYMLGRYANDIYLYDRLLSSKQDSVATHMQNYLQGIHHKHDLRFNFYKLFSLMAMSAQDGKALSFYELGQTLFGCIEGMIFGKEIIEQLIANKTNLALDSVNWYGVDISPFFNYLSKKFHPQFNVFTGDTFEHLPGKLDVFFAKGVTMLYAVSKANSIIELMNSCHCGYFDYSFSMNGDEICYIPTGKQVTYVDFTAFLALLNQQNYDVIVNQNTAKYNHETKRLYVECFYGSKEECQQFTKNLCTFEQALFQALLPVNGVFEALMDAKAVSHWVPLADFAGPNKVVTNRVLETA